MEGKQYYSVYKKENVSQTDGYNVVFQGDSWGELLDGIDSFSKSMLVKADIFINGGTSSYSPSLMEIQLRDIVTETRIKPSILISYIDQTDFMDENCDYAKKRIEHNGRLVAVLKPSGVVLERSAADLTWAKFATGMPKLQFFIENRLNSLSRPKMAMQSSLFCKFDDIVQFMASNPSEVEINIFIHSLKSYLDYALEVADKVVLLTHKHRKHYEGTYQNDIYSILVKALDQINLSHKVSVIDLSPENIADLDDVFPSFEADPASHPHMFYYENYLAKKIMELI